MIQLDPLVTRSLSATAVCAACAVLLTALMVVAAVVDGRLRDTFASMPPAVRRAVDQCQAGIPPPDPIRTPTMVFSLYDGETFRGAAASPPLSEETRVGLTRKGFHSQPALWPFKQKITRLLSTGPCGVLSVSTARSPLLRPDRLLVLIVVMVLAGAAASLIGYFVIARPLLSRVHTLGRSAAAIGTRAFEASATSDWDDLKVLAAALTAADQRIRTNEAALADRSRQLERVIASVAHDLKTPLATLQLMLQRLIDHPEPAESTRLGRAALDAAHSVGALLSNLEIDTQIKAGQLATAKQAIDLRGLLEQLEIRFRVLGDLRQIQFRASWPDIPVWADTDPTIAERILSNLIENAMKHGRPYGNVAVLLEAKPSWFVCTVTDDGPGLPDEVVAAFRAGEPIRSISNPTRSPLGLAIVERLCRHAGWIVSLGRSESMAGGLVLISGPLSGNVASSEGTNAAAASPVVEV